MLEVLRLPPYFPDLRKTPEEVSAEIARRGWRSVFETVFPAGLNAAATLFRMSRRSAAIARGLSILQVSIAVLLLSSAGCTPTAITPPPDLLSCLDCNLVLVSLDTVRADHLGCYGYDRQTTPRIDRFVGGALLFEHARATAYHTAESHTTMFTALLPSVHGVHVRLRPDEPARPILPGAETLAEKLSAAGFLTGGFHDGGNLGERFGFERGFDVYVEHDTDTGPALAWLRERRARPEQRFFLFFHTYRAHMPYLPDPPYRDLWEADYRGAVLSDRDEFNSLLSTGSFPEQRELYWGRVDPTRAEDLRKVIALYDGALRQLDDEVAPLLEEAAALERPTLIVVVADHGEEFYEHGHFTHSQLYEQLLRVPWIVHHPLGAGAGLRISTPVSLLDLAPTLLDLLGVAPFRLAQGRSLAGALGAGLAPRRGGFVSEKVRLTEPKTGDPLGVDRAVVRGTLKLLAFHEGRFELFDLARDPGERENLYGTIPDSDQMVELATAIDERSRRLREVLVRSGVGDPVEASAETLRQLQALGYL